MARRENADGLVLGRMATEIARVLRGKHKPVFAPHVDTGDHVVVVNAPKVVLTSNKADREASTANGYPGGIKSDTYGELLAKKPEEAIRRTVKGMLPKGPLGRQMLTKLKVYAGPDHPTQAQSPVPLDCPRRGPLTLEADVLATPLTRLPASRAGHRPCPPATRHRRDDRHPSVRAVLTTPAHRMEASEPLRVAEVEDRFDIDATIKGGGVSGQGRGAPHGARPLPRRGRARDSGQPQEGRLAHPRREEEGEQEVRPQEGPQGAAVHEALTRRPACLLARSGCP